MNFYIDRVCSAVVGVRPRLRQKLNVGLVYSQLG